MSSHLVTLANSTSESVLLYNLNGAILSSHMQLVIVSRSLPHIVATCAGSFYEKPKSHAKSRPVRSELSSVKEEGQRHVCTSPKNACREDLKGTRV
jgi:hypothetical protein